MIDRTPGAPAARGESEKKTEYREFLSEYDFVPLELESTGVWGAATRDWVTQIGRRIGLRTGNRRARVFLMQRVSIEIKRGDARMISASLSQCTPLEEIFNLPGVCNI